MYSHIFSKWIRNTSTVFVCAAFLSGCLSDDKGASTFSGAPDPGVPTNTAPQISGTPAGNVNVGESYSFTPSASDADGDSLTFSISNRPTWAGFDSSTGQLSGIPTIGDAGTDTNIVISVSDGTESTSLAAFSITVDAVATNTAPQISGTPAGSVTVGASYSFTPSASDADGDPLTFSISNQPTWASFDSSTGRLSGVPGSGDIGTDANIVISVSDGSASDSLAAFSITVNAAGSNTAPQISGTPAGSVNVGESYSFTPSASDADGDTLTFSVSNQPTWASFDSSNGRLTGVPASGDIGTDANIVISVSDGSALDRLPAFSITVNAAGSNTAPQISGTPADSVAEGQSYSFVPTASDVDGDTLTFSISGQPTWASFDTSTGELSGTPGAGDVGVYSNIVISVSDGVANASLPSFSITVNAISLGSATLSWTAPTLNEDGTQLTDLAGYILYWGTTPGTYPNSATIDNPSVLTYVVENLSPGTYEFVATAYNIDGEESRYSGTATKVVP